MIEESIPQGLMKDFEILTKILKHPARLALGRQLVIPDFPPLSYFSDTDTEPTALHDTKTKMASIYFLTNLQCKDRRTETGIKVKIYSSGNSTMYIYIYIWSILHVFTLG